MSLCLFFLALGCHFICLAYSYCGISILCREKIIQFNSIQNSCSTRRNFVFFDFRYWLDLTSDDVMWNLSDTGWAKSAYSSLFAPWWQGSCVFVYNAPKFDVQETLSMLKKYPISVACFPPTAYRMFAANEANLVAQRFKGIKYCSWKCTSL